MAKVKRNMIVSGLSGTLDEYHYARVTRDGRTIISLKPDFGNRQFSEAQIRHQQRMKESAAYAKVASRENPLYAKLAEGTSSNAYNLALKDRMKPPVIRSMDLYSGHVIRVQATDNVKVIKVIITVLDPRGQLLEQGEAELTLGVWWDYRPAHQGQIQAEAWDMAGNVTQRQFDNPWVFTPFRKNAK
jgi:hypothetical protein